MSTAVKVLIVLGLVLPLGAFVAGSLAASGADDPGPRAPIVIPHQPRGTATPGEDRSPSHDRSDDHSDDHGGVGVITPSPDDIDDHSDDSGRDGEMGDDHGGGPGSDDSGSGSSGSSGSSSSSGSGSGSGSGSSGSDDSGHGGHG